MHGLQASGELISSTATILRLVHSTLMSGSVQHAIGVQGWRSLPGAIHAAMPRFLDLPFLSPFTQAVICAAVLVGALALYLHRFASPRRWLAIALGICLLDQAAKVWAARWFILHDQPPLYLLGGWLRLVYQQNHELGFGSTPGPLLLMTACLVVALLILYRRLGRRRYRMTVVIEVACALLLGGLLGILVDRIRLGGVVDFAQFRPPFDYTCNIADLAAVSALPLFAVRWGRLLVDRWRAHRAGDGLQSQARPAAPVVARNRWAWQLAMVVSAAVALWGLWRVPHDSLSALPPLHQASYRGDVGAVCALVDDGVNVHEVGRYGSTPLHYAAMQGHTEVAEILLGAGADVTAEAPRGDMSALDWAILRGHVETANLLMAHGAEPSGAALCLAVDSENAEMVEQLLKSGSGGATPALLRATWRGVPRQIVKLLLDAGADVRARDEQGRTALHQAASRGDAESARMLLDAGADPNARDAEGKTPLHVIGGLAPSLGGPSGTGITALLVEHGADVNARSGDRMTPLIDAVLRRETERVELLLSAGAEAGARGPRGWTPLHYAAAKGLPDIAEVLLRAGADAAAATEDGRTPLALATDPKTAALLRGHGALT